MTDPEIVDQQAYADDTVAVVPVSTTLPPSPSATRSTTQKAQETARNAYRVARMILFVLLGFILALFVFRNWEDVPLDYVFGSVDLPLAIVMLIFTAIGLVMGLLLYWFLARRAVK
ncbi:MAG: DUF1049 domain-containing protein [Thermomicrobiales bacterium]|jgi:uncharacterized integral membrane protein|nr:DUF1049 domain-containing protein [Thermomicrobiales bacterium]